MLFSSPRASLVALAASAVAVSASPGLTVKTSTPSTNVDGLQNLKVTTTITNTGDEILKLLNDPRGVLDPFPGNSFTITDASGSRPSFVGATVNHLLFTSYMRVLILSSAFRSSTVPRTPLASMIPGVSPFSLLAPQSTLLTIVSGTKSILLAHGLMGESSSVPAAYDFARSGAGYYSIKPSNLFIYIGGDGTPKGLYATVEDIVEVKLSGNLAVSRVQDKRATFVSCSSTRRSQINVAASSAQTYASRAYSYIQSISSGTRRYTTWFGAYTASRKSIVQDRFRLISGYRLSTFTYDCTCTNPGIYAYVCAYIFDREIAAQSLINLFVRSQPIREDLPVRCLLERPQHRHRFQGWNSYPRIFLLYRRRRCR